MTIYDGELSEQIRLNGHTVMCRLSNQQPIIIKEQCFTNHSY